MKTLALLRKILKIYILYNFVIFALPAAAQYTTQGQWDTNGQFTMNSVNPAPATPPVIQTTTLASCTQNAACSPVTLAATGGTPCGSPSYTPWLVSSGSLPPGRVLSSAGVLSGIGTLAGTYNFQVTATDCSAPAHLTSAPQALIMIILPPPSGDLSVENLYCAIADVCNFFTAGATDGPALLNTAGMYTATNGTPASSGNTCSANTAATFTACLASASPGDVIQLAVPSLDAGGTYDTGSGFQLPVKANDITHWVWIESAQVAAGGFPAEHTRATPGAINQATVANYPTYSATTASLMPTIRVTQANGRGFTAAAGAHHYRMIGLNVTKAAGVPDDSALIDMSNGADHILVDRSLVHGLPVVCSWTGTTYTCNVSDEMKQGVNFNNCTYCGVINSWVYDISCFTGCTDAVGVAWGTGSSATGPIVLYNDLLAAGGESWLSGGGGNLPAIPTNCEIRHNHSFKPVNWILRSGLSGQHPIFKNLGELKNEDKCLIEGNEFENSWTSAVQSDQAGFANLITPKNQGTVTQGTATSDGSGNLTAVTSSFSNVLAAGCPVSGHCYVTYNSIRYQAQTQADSTHISVQNAGPVFPPASATPLSFTACTAGPAPNVYVANVTYRYNHIRNTDNGIQLLSATSSFCSDESQGLRNIEVRDNLADGLNDQLSNAAAPQNFNDFVELLNSQQNNVAHDITIEHNTVAITEGVAFSSSGLGQSIDTTNSSVSGSGCQTGTGAYFANLIIRNNLAPAGWIPGYKSGTVFPGGTLCGLQQQGCPDHATGCTFQMAKNVFGQALWSKQTLNKPYPATNADPADNPAGSGCNASSQTCFPSGSGFTGLFVNYNSGYNGDYHLAASSPYAGAGTDAKDLGANIDLGSNYRNGPTGANPAWHATTYTPAVITQGLDLPTPTLPSGAAGVAYGPLQLTASSASDFQAWVDTDGFCLAGATGNCIPNGMTLSRAGVLGGTPSTVGSYTLHLKMYDGAGQSATATLPLTIITSVAAVDLMTWISATNPTRVNFHQTGSSNPAYSWMDADGVKWWDEKAGTGHPWDVRTYGVNGGSNAAVCADYAPGKASICNWLTDFGSGGNFTNASAYKKQDTPFPTLPRTYTLGTMVTIDTPGPNSSVSTTNCEGVGTTNGNLGATHTVSSYFASLPWGGSVGTQATVLEEYYYTKNGTGHYGQIYNDRERFFHVQPYGRVTWDHATWDGPSQAYIVDSTNTLNTQTAGGAPSPSFPCFGAGVTNWIGGTPGTGGNATTP